MPRYLQGVKYLTPGEVAKLLGITYPRALAAIRDGKLKAVMFGYRPYVSQVEAERFLEEELNRSVDVVAAKLLRALRLRVRLVFSGDNGRKRG